jgi:hypothetical protein
MEGKELHNEDDERKSGSKSNNEESDDFGLPDASFGSESEEGSESSEEGDSSSNIYTTGEDSDSGYSSESEPEEPSRSYQYTSDDDDNGKKTPVGLIVFLSLIGVIIVAIAIYWFFIRTPKEEIEPIQEPVVVEDTTNVEPVFEEPEPEPVEVVEEPIQPEEGTFTTITNRTGRYYIVLNSFFDEDLANDFAKKLANSGVNTVILGGQDKKAFKRVALSEDFGGWTDAESRMNELKGTYGEEIWVLKY